MSMSAVAAQELSNWAIGGVSAGALALFLIPGFIVVFKPELMAAGMWWRKRVRLTRSWVKGTRHEVRVTTLLWLTEHRFQNIAAYLGLRPAELGIL